jgi:hypothetical protein
MASVGGGAARGQIIGWLRDVLRFPYREFEIDTELPQTEVVERVRAIVEPGSVFLASFKRTNKLFTGEVWPDGFKVMRLIYYGNSGLPVVEGRIQPGPKGTRVQVTMRLMQFTRIVSMLWFGFLGFFVVAILFAGLFSSQKDSIGSASAMLGFSAAMGLFGYLIFAAPFGLEALKARGLLEEALQVTPGPRIQRVLDAAPPRLSRLAKYLLGVGAIAGLGSVLGVVVPHLMIGSAPYQIAESFIRSNPVVQDELGRVRGVNLELTGNSVSYAGPEGSARFAFDVQGSRGNGIVLVVVRKHLGVWHIGNADLREADGRIISLQAEAAVETGEHGR